MEENSYVMLAAALDALPNRFPAAEDGSHLRLLERLFAPEEAGLAAQLSPELETAEQLAERLGSDAHLLHQQLKQMARRGLIGVGSTGAGLGFRRIPFVVGIYENQIGVIDAEMAALFERYYHSGFRDILGVPPAVHRVIPVGESVEMGLEVRPYESAAGLVGSMQAWGVQECICRKQKQLLGEGCSHPLDVCLVMSSREGAFDRSQVIKALTQAEALATLRRAAEAGLVHSVSNNQKDVWYVCNCCTCSCGILRGMAELGIASVVAKSDYVNRVDQDRCIVCGDCVERCQFDALVLGERLEVSALKCAGCGVCVLACPEEALHLVLRPEAEIVVPPERERDWLAARERARAGDTV